MAVLPFRGEPHDHVHLHLHLAKGDRRRRFWVRALDYDPGVYKGQIWFDGRVHRELKTRNIGEVVSFRIECEAEVKELEQDGWVRIAATLPNSQRWAR